MMMMMMIWLNSKTEPIILILCIKRLVPPIIISVNQIHLQILTPLIDIPILHKLQHRLIPFLYAVLNLIETRLFQNRLAAGINPHSILIRPDESLH